ncbi:MAG: hypothetical protein DMG06_26855, partial [Acidobacteria bacterium]
MPARRHKLLFLLFFISGFCGLLYQVIWVRLAFASFGVITPVLSVVVSVFMLGLSLGSWAGGKLVAPLTQRLGVSAILLYAWVELMIGVGAFIVPSLFSFGETLLLQAGESDSLSYLLFSAGVIALSIFPWCAFMGATFPLMMGYVSEFDRSNTRSFSFLYLANVVGAMFGTLMTAAILVELFGFRHTLWVAGCSNFLIAAISVGLSLHEGRRIRVNAWREDTNSPPPEGSYEKIEGTAGTCPPSNEGGLQGGRWKSAPSLDSAVATPLKSPLEKGDDLRRTTFHADPRILSHLHGRNDGSSLEPEPTSNPSQEGKHSILPARSFTHLILFTTGFTSLAMEVVWTRAFTPVLGTQVYAFALLLFVYLLATWIGSYLYRRTPAAQGFSTAQLITLLAVFAFLPVILNDPRLSPLNRRNLDPRINPLNTHVFPVLASIFPFCAVLGYLTPHLIDESAGGNPRRAGKAYALNILGCILGPLFASYIFLPLAGAKLSMVALALPFLGFFLGCSGSLGPTWRWAGGLVSTFLLLSSLFISASYDAPRGESANYVIRRDHTATVISDGTGMDKGLSVNGVVITLVTPITKFMAHLPLAFHKSPPQSALVICFGMGTTYRSLMSWDIQATAVELVPSVKEAFSYYFDDANAILKNPKGRIVVDDGRRFLRRTSESFDIITVDPPPPAEAAGSSLLYSEEFYRLVKERLKPNGILQQWFAVGEEKILQAVARSLANSFPYVRVYPSIAGWGYHFLASMSPLEAPTVEELIERLPQPARNDLLEWSAGKGLKEYLDPILSKE